MFKLLMSLMIAAVGGLTAQNAWGAEVATPPSSSSRDTAAEPGAAARKVVETYSRTLADGEHRLTVTTTQGQQVHLLVKDQSGKVVFDGPVATAEQIAKLPAAVATKLQRLQQKLPVVEAKEPEAASKATPGTEVSAIAAQAKSPPKDESKTAAKSPAAYRQLLEKKEYKDNPNILNLIAWAMVDPEVPFENPDLDVALTAALRANEIAKGDRSDILDTVARVYFTRGDVAKAIEFQTLAVEKASEPEKANATKTLSQYQARQTEKKSTP